MSRIYITHCSAKKDSTLKHTGVSVTPNRLYTATPTKRFMNRCIDQGVEWAIFSDLYGVWLPHEAHPWYEKHPSKVTPAEFQILCSDFDNRLASFDEIWFYHNPGRFHPLYRQLLNTVALSNSITLFSHLRQIMVDSSLCGWLHNTLLRLPLVKYPFDLESLPENGIYFFYQEGETVDHGNWKGPRIVRVGTHKNGNFQSRIDQHFLVEKEIKKMSFGPADRAPKDRSIFRNHMGRCSLVKRGRLDYIPIWKTNFILKKHRTNRYQLNRREITLEKEIELEITKTLREDFSFRYIIIDSQEDRMGDRGFEKKLVGTLSACELCNPSRTWLGCHHPDQKVSSSGLWQVHYLRSPGITTTDCKTIESMVNDTLMRLDT